jgi:hypothetical protein
MTINCLRIYKGGARDRHRYSVDGVVTKLRKAKAYFGSEDRHSYISKRSVQDIPQAEAKSVIRSVIAMASYISKRRQGYLYKRSQR